MWELTGFETRLQTALKQYFGTTKGATKFGDYTSPRQVLAEDIYEEIRGTEPHLTDHGPRHIRNVLENVEKLLAGSPEYFNATELYVLGLGVLFHDVGNIDGRKGHNQRIAKYYDHARPGHRARWADEKRLVIAAAKAHTGKAADGSRDTLKELHNDHHLGGERVRLCEIAAVIRLADELAEGIQRTSAFLQSEGRYSRDSQVHHQYAAITNVAIDAGVRRISLTYNLIIDDLGSTSKEQLQQLRTLLAYMYLRIAKLDAERKYARYYCGNLLGPFQETSVWIGVDVNNELDILDYGPVYLDDKVVPEGGRFRYSKTPIRRRRSSSRFEARSPRLSQGRIMPRGATRRQTEVPNEQRQPLRVFGGDRPDGRRRARLLHRGLQLLEFIQSKRNIFLLGERGSGKTMTLRYNTLNIQRRKAERDNKSVDLSRIGVYVPCNAHFTHRREYELLEAHQAGILSEHFFVLSIVHALVDTLDKASDILGDVPDAEFVKEFEVVTASELPGEGSFFSRIRLFVNAENQRTNLAINRADQDFYFSAHSFSTMAMPVLELLARVPSLADAHFLLMIDDADYLNPHQIASLNSWIAYRDHSQFSFKVATPKVSMPTRITASGGSILEGHDYTVVDLEKPLQNEHSDFGRLAEQIIARRQQRIDSSKSPREYFPVSPATVAQLDECKAEATRHAHEKFPDGTQKQITDYVYKYHRALFFRRAPKANLPVYSGFEMITYLSTGVVRNLLEPCFWMYDKAVSLAGSDKISEIDPMIQNEVIMELSKRTWSQIESGVNYQVAGCTEAQATQIRNLFEALARRFRQRLLSGHSEPRATSFTISGPDSAQRREVEELLLVARKALLLYSRTGAAKEAGSRETYYVPVRTLWPARGLDPQGQHARISLKARDLLAAARGEYPWDDADGSTRESETKGTLFDVN